MRPQRGPEEVQNRLQRGPNEAPRPGCGTPPEAKNGHNQKERGIKGWKHVVLTGTLAAGSGPRTGPKEGPQRGPGDPGKVTRGPEVARRGQKDPNEARARDRAPPTLFWGDASGETPRIRPAVDIVWDALGEMHVVGHVGAMFV